MGDIGGQSSDLNKSVHPLSFHFSFSNFRYVWKWGRHMAMAHDSYLCERYIQNVTMGFPTERKNELLNFVGANSKHKSVWEECPKKCRRIITWTYC